MDYTKSPLWFRIRKVLRYARMYGVSRTLAKVRGQYHMHAQYDVLPVRKKSASGARHVGIIGCGNFAFSTIAYHLNKEVGQVLRGVMDIDIHRAASLFEHYRAAYYTTDAEEVLSDPAIDLVYIASNHASHAEYAIAAIEAGKAVHIEKPHVVNEDQLHRLLATAETVGNALIRLGFNRPLSPLSQHLLTTMDTQEGTSIINWFVAGHKLDPDHWYLHPSEGGRVLGNLCHWTDFNLHLIPTEGRYPIRIIPGRADRSDCNIAVSCVFGDGSISTITFSEKGEPFEGVHEQLHVHKGDLLVSMTNFSELVIENMECKNRFRPLFRQHGHKQTILASYGMSERGGNAPGVDIEYIRQTAELFLATRAALEADREIVLDSSGIESLKASIPHQNKFFKPIESVISDA